ncbi:MAG: rane fusion protein copper/silver efflux system [Thermodesulfobacteriota bacterium]|nr:rane fusion protein copper/silver efflux system [Thermodesulfobacteriota bacterium]
MKRISFITITGFIFLIGSALVYPVFAGSEKFDEKMQPILEEYLKIVDTLASDKTEGVADAAKKIDALTGTLSPSLVTGEHSAHYKGIPGKISDGAKKMALVKDISSLREALVGLSKPMVMWASMSKPSGINVIYCSMNPGSWLQKGKKIRNPYYGSKMLTCGEIISGPDAKK